MQHQVYLSRRNLLTLLAKLDARAAGEFTSCTIVKSDNKHPTHPQTMESIMITAIEDANYYTDRLAGEVHPREETTLRAK
jgi:hypothetical protein